jgi:serine/threonine protein kinase
MNTAPQRIGPYVVLSEMGHGGGGIVTRCRHDTTGGLAAVKLARDASGPYRDFLRKEVTMLSRLGREGNAGVVRVIESGIDGGILWYAMEFIEGPDLSVVAESLWTGGVGGILSRTVTDVAGLAGEALLSLPPPGGGSRPLPAAAVPALRPEAANGHLKEVLDLVRRLAQVVAFVHGQGIVHGDVKPTNVLYRSDGESVLVDFGAALYAFAGATTREVAQIERLRHGTRGYMAPEQIRGEPLDGRCDLYALGCILFELLVGRRPFMADDPIAMQNQHLQVSPPAPSQLVDEMPPSLDDLVLRLLAKDPRERIGYAEDVIETLDSLLAPRAEARPAGSSPRHLYRPRMAGRDTELERALVRLRSARDGRGGLLFVAGESGVGKTRFVNELGGQAVGLRMAVVTGQSSEIAQSTGAAVALRGAAFQPFVPLLHRVLDRCSNGQGEKLAEQLQGPLAVLAPYEPSLAGLAAVARQRPSELPHALARTRVFRSMAEVIVRLAQERPLLLVLDDLHWADDLTLAFLQSRHLRAIEEAPVLIVATYRSEQVDPELHAAAQAQPGALISLERLTLESIRSMVKDMLASPMAPEGLVQFLHRHSEGNPFFAAEYLHTIIRRGLLFRDPDRLWQGPELAVADQGDADLPVPASLQGLLEARMEGLGAAAAGVLELACVLGREFDLDLLEAFHEGPTGGDALAVEELVARQIIEESGPRRYRFVHDKLREARERAIAAERRRTLHAIAARRLEEVGAGAREPGVRDAQVGSHWARAGVPERAFPFLERGARAAEEVYANAQAVQLYQLALGQAEAAGLRAQPEGRGTLRGLAEALADLLVRNAHHADGRGHYDWALTLTDRQAGPASARLWRKKAHSFWTVHQYEQAAAALTAAEGELGPPAALDGAEQHREWIEIQQGHFWRYYFARQTGPATERIIAEMAEAVERHGTVRQRATYYVCAALDILGRRRYLFSDEAVAFTRKALEAAGGHPGCVAEASLARFNLGFALLLGQRSCCREAADQLREAAAEAERIGDATLLARALTYLAVAHRRLGAVDEAAAAVDRAMGAAEDAQLAPYVGAVAACRAWVHWKRGEPEASRQSAALAQRWWRKGEHAFPFRWLVNFPLLELEMTDEAFEAARTLIGDLLDDQQQLFPPELDAALRTASSVPPDSYRSFAEATRRVLDLAALLGYV